MSYETLPNPPCEGGRKKKPYSNYRYYYHYSYYRHYKKTKKNKDK